MPAAQRLKIQRMTSIVRERILTAPPEAGVIHSVFARALNILWHDGGLLTLHGPGLLAAPFAAAIPHLPLPACVCRDSPVRWDGARLVHQGFLLTLEGAATVEARISPAGEGLDLLGATLRNQAARTVAPALSSARGRRAHRKLADGLARSDPDRFAEGACALVGLGEGLTPAGDDCLVGALAVLHRFASSWFRSQAEVRGRVSAAARIGTTTLGREFLLHALDGAFSELLTRLVTALSREEARQAAVDLAATGGTSGADTLAGVGLALEALLGRAA